MYNSHQVRNLEIEISTFCGAACAQCARTDKDGHVRSSVPLTRWDLDQISSSIDSDFVAQLETMSFNGAHGEPMLNRDIVRMASWAKTANPNLKLLVDTSGQGHVRDFAELAAVADRVCFNIDGWQDTNHIYRRNLLWEDIINNAQAFIHAGGHAVWRFRVFKHNQHQIDMVRYQSQALGFREFELVRNWKFDQSSDVGQPDTAWQHPIFFQTSRQQPEISCQALAGHSVYVAGDGFVFPCRWLHEQYYTDHGDARRLGELMLGAGSWRRANLFHSPLRDIIDGAWFAAIQRSWYSTKPLDTCARLCDTQGCDIPHTLL